MESAGRAASALCVGLAAVVAIAASDLAFVRPGDDESLTTILERTATYVRQFERDLGVVIANEDYDQHRTLSGRPALPQRRRIRSEMLFMWLPEEEHWLSVRNVTAVDGRVVADSKARLDRALADPAPERVSRLRRLRDEGARFNIGTTYRNFNDPNLTLLFVDAAMQSRFKFAIEGNDKIDKNEAWRITFTEQEQPTVIQDYGSNLPSKGSIWVSVRDAAVLRTELSVSQFSRGMTTDAQVGVDYRREPRLDLWVPSRMEETYITWSMPRTERERIECVATYSSYRRFETSGRILTPK